MISGWIIRMGMGCLALCLTAHGEGPANAITDRQAIERVYHQHRTGPKPPFEQVLPADALERLVRRERLEEFVLRSVYGIEITPAILQAEVDRINTTTRAPEMLAEIKAALDNDPERFARSFVKPILVSQLLRERFANDDALHAAQRRECERLRSELLAARTNSATTTEMLTQLKGASSLAVSEFTWHFSPASREGQASQLDEPEIERRFSPSAGVASLHPTAPAEPAFHFDDLPPLLQRVLNAQLRQPGDLSAVIEMPDAFALYLCRARDEHALSVTVLTIPKRSYEQWLETQSQPGTPRISTDSMSRMPFVPNQARHPASSPTP